MKGLNVQKRIASSILKGSVKRIKFDKQRLEEIKEAITRADLKGLISGGLISLKKKKGVSRARANQIQRQKSKGQKKGQGKRKGKFTARKPKKETWVSKIRTQRSFIKDLKQKDLIANSTYRDLYSKSKGGFFRSKRHIKIYLNEHKLFLDKANQDR
ncbi:MAG: 50S ribosomal protein L19e [Nanobdellota archaeon]